MTNIFEQLELSLGCLAELVKDFILLGDLVDIGRLLWL